MKAIQIGDRVSLNFFHKVSFHKHVKYTTKYHDKEFPRKNWESENFYINADYYEGKLSMIITPKFLMSGGSKFYFMGNNKFQARSDHGITDFEILEGLS